MNKEQKELLKIQLENLKNVNKAVYYQRKNEELVNEVSILESEVDMLYKRIELCKIFCNKFVVKNKDGKQGFKNFNGVDIVKSILNGTSNFAKLEGLKEYEEVEVLE